MLSTLPTIADVVKRDYLGEHNACGRGDGTPGRAGRHKGVPYGTPTAFPDPVYTPQPRAYDPPPRLAKVLQC